MREQSEHATELAVRLLQVNLHVEWLASIDAVVATVAVTTEAERLQGVPQITDALLVVAAPIAIEASVWSSAELNVVGLHEAELWTKRTAKVRLVARIAVMEALLGIETAITQVLWQSYAEELAEAAVLHTLDFNVPFDS